MQNKYPLSVIKLYNFHLLGTDVKAGFYCRTWFRLRCFLNTLYKDAMNGHNYNHKKKAFRTSEKLEQ